MPSELLKTKPAYPIFDDFTQEEFATLTDEECEQIGENSRTNPATGYIQAVTPAMRDAWLLSRRSSPSSPSSPSGPSRP